MCIRDRGFHFVEDDLPFCVDDGLVFGDLLDADFGVVFFGFEFELDVEADDFGVGEAFRLLLEAGVGEGLFEGDAVDELGVLEGSAGDAFDSDELLV